MAQDLLTELHRRGIKLRLTDTGLDVVAPAGSLTAELRAQLAGRRDELLALLRAVEPDSPLPEIVPRPQDRHEPFPLTDIQHAYWVGRNPAVTLGGVATHFYFELERDGLDPDRLRRSLQRVVDRHDMLRAVVGPDGRQRVLADPPPYPFPVTDLRTVPAADRDARLDLLRQEMGHQVMATDRWPLFDIRVSLLPDARTRLHVSLDVLIIDALSLHLLFADWRRFYEEPDWAPEPLPLVYRDYVLAEEALRGGQRYRDDRDYWLRQLDTLPPAPALPLATQPERLSRVRFTRRSGRLDRQRWDAVKAAAKQRRLTPSGVLMTAFADVLRTWSGQPDLTLNLTLFNRLPLHPDIGKVLGDFTSVTMLAATDPGAGSFTGRAERLQQQLRRDLEHVSFSGVRVLREHARRSGGGLDASMPVVFTSALFLTSDEETAGAATFFGEFVHAISQTPQVWLDHQVTEDRGELQLEWDSVDELFPDGLVADMLAVFLDVLDRLATDPGAWDTEADLVALPAWQRAERAAANDTAQDIPARTLGDLVEEQAGRTPGETAVLADDGSLTYGELVGRARRLAHRLVELGARRDTLVGVVAEKGLDQVVAVLGVVLSGAGYLPVDPDWPEARREQLLTQGGVSVVVTGARQRSELGWPAGLRLVTPADPEVAAADPARPLPAVGPDDLAYVIFTSGSTGRPKGVAIDHRGAANTVQDINRRFAVGPADRVLALSALSFDLSVWDVFGLLAAGGTVVLPAPVHAHDPAHWTELVERHQVTVWNTVPALMQAWMDSGSTGPSLRLALLSGDWIPVGLPDTVRGRHPGTALVSLGGATEASIWSIWYPIGDVPPEWSRIPYGRPLANQTMHVLDRGGRDCPVWTTGELHIGGVGVARCYWADPERTAERFVTHPVTGERLYRTGDLGRYLPGGDIEFLGRADFQVKLNGYRIELGEIAATLQRQPGVADALVGVNTNPATGRRQLVAHVVPAAADGPVQPEVGDWPALLSAGGTAVADGERDLADELATYRATTRAADAVCPAILARTLARLGEFRSRSDRATAEEIVERGRLDGRYRGLIARWLEVLTEHGRLREDGDGYRAVEPLDPDRLDAEVRAGLDGIPAAGTDAVLLDYVRACAAEQERLLSGQVNPLELLLPGGDQRVTEALYAGNPVSRSRNRIAAAVVRSQLGDPPLRVLEVGAGTGSTTRAVLAALPAEQIRYLFTDVSTYFTERARRTFADHPNVEYRTYDIDKDPASQGVPPGSVDVVLAANVMHDAKDLPATLRQLGTALAPGGTLVLVEATANSLLQLVTVGFLEGFSSYGRDRELPLLAAGRWTEELAGAGCAATAAFPAAFPAADPTDQHVVVGRAAGGAPRVAAEELRRALQDLLPDYMVPHHYLVLDKVPLTANGKVDRSALPTPWLDVRAAQPVAPRTDLERTVAEIWREVLERGDFGVEDNFFELGGDSLHAVRILGLLRDRLGVEQNADDGIRRLFENPTVAALAAALPNRAEV